MNEEEFMNMAKNIIPKNMTRMMTTKDRLKKKLEEKNNKK